jgi:hypothetical protein
MIWIIVAVLVPSLLSVVLGVLYYGGSIHLREIVTARNRADSEVRRLQRDFDAARAAYYEVLSKNTAIVAELNRKELKMLKMLILGTEPEWRLETLVFRVCPDSVSCQHK